MLFVETPQNKIEYEFSPNAIATLATLSSNYEIVLYVCDYKFTTESDGNIAVQELMQLNCIEDIVVMLPAISSKEIDELMDMELTTAISPTTLFEFTAEKAIEQFDLHNEKNVFILSSHVHSPRFEKLYANKIVSMTGILEEEVCANLITKILT